MVDLWARVCFSFNINQTKKKSTFSSPWECNVSKKSKIRSCCSCLGFSSPDIIINHIFVRLPVKSALRCRSVGKQWLQLFTDPYFISLHFHHHNLNTNQQIQILCGPISYKEGLPGESKEDYREKWKAFYGVFYSLHLHSSSESAEAVSLPGFPLLHKTYFSIRTIGYCNGLICMVVTNYKLKGVLYRYPILIGNPSTGNYKILPQPTHFSPIIGFCYDSVIDDYKCVMVDRDTRNPHIFRLKLNSWRTNFDSSDKGKIMARNFGFEHYNIGVALHRSMYWLVDTSNIIVEFDLDDEEFIDFPLPSEMPNSHLLMTVLAGSLCITYICYENREVDMWLMSKEGNKNKYCCWSKLIKVNIYDFGYFTIHPLSFMKDGKILCRLKYSLEENLFILLDPKTRSIEDFSIHHETGHDWLEQFNFEAPHMAYTDSLVSPN